MKTTGIWVLAGMVALSAGCGGDEPTTQQSQTGSTTAVGTSGAAATTAVVQEQLAFGSKQQGLAQLAADRASRAEVRTFAEELVRGHDQTYSPLERIARDQQITVPESEQLRVERQRLATLSGEQFDREYLTEIISDHENAVSDLERISREGDQAIREWATETLPVIRRHLETARRLQQGGPGTGRLP